MHASPYFDNFDGRHMDGGFGIFGFITTLIIVGAIVWLAFYLIRTLSSNSRLQSGHRDPVDIARERYAKGEITKAELAEIKKELKA